jgi:beta-xylosidase
MVLLGIRAKGQWPPYHVLGREVFLAPVRWVDGWPVVDPVETVTAGPAPSRALWPAEREEFDDLRLSPQWISPRSRPDGAWSLSERPGWLTLHATGATLDRSGATIIARRQQHHDCRASVRVEAGSGRAGLTLRIDEAHHYDLEIGAGRASVIGRVGPFRQVFNQWPVPVGAITITIATRTHDVLPPTVTSPDQLAVADAPFGVPAAGSDTITFAVETDEGRVVLAELDGRYLSTEVASGFTGRVFGMYVTEGSAAFDWFAYEPVQR